MRIQATKAYPLFALIFLALGGLTLLNVVAAWQDSQTFLLQGFCYGLMNLLVAYAFYKRESWLVYAFTLNFFANLFLVIVNLSTNGADLWTLGTSLFSLAVMGGIASVIYLTKRSLKTTPYSMYTGVLFALLWVSTFALNTLFTL